MKIARASAEDADALTEIAFAAKRHWQYPASWIHGVGRALFRHAEEVARESGAMRMQIVGDPHAEQFYSRMGATVYGREPASLGGEERFLPLFEKTL